MASRRSSEADGGLFEGDDEVFFPSVSSASTSPVVMPKTAASACSAGGGDTGGGGLRLNPRKIWCSRSASQSRLASTHKWTPQKDCRWTSLSGRQVVLADTTLLNLTEVERIAVRQLALAKLQTLNLGCTIALPKETAETTQKPKKRPILLKKRSVTTGFFADKKDKDRPSLGLVFGVPLSTCIRNDRQRMSGSDVEALPRSQSTSAEDVSRGRLGRSGEALGGSHTSFNLLLDPKDEARLMTTEEAHSCESLNLDVKRRSVLGLSDLLSLSGTSSDWERCGGLLVTPGPQVPDIVTTCLRHIETYGLNTLGIFRVSSSRKRVRQLREEFDTGLAVELGSEYCPHDVATILKEYFRDLPEPLLTRELYPAFVITQKVRNRKHQLEALRHLIQLLPVANRDTLWLLLQFLARVASNSADHKNAAGDWVTGNKMDSNNLATLFGPNLLHTVKSGRERDFLVVNAARAEERIDVINAVRSMIDNHKTLFQVSAQWLHEAYGYVQEKNPDVLDHLLRMRLSSSDVDVDLDTSNSMLESIDAGLVLVAPTAEPETTTDEGVRGRTRQRSSSQPEPTSGPVEPANLPTRLFRKREKGTKGDAEHDSSSTRWFRRRERNATKNLDAAIDAANRETSPSRVRPLNVSKAVPQQQQVSVIDIRKERLSVPGDTTAQRRLSSPDMDATAAIISASLTLKVPLTAASSPKPIALNMDDRDIPFIEDLRPDQELEVPTRCRALPYSDRRHRSSPFLPRKTDEDLRVRPSQGRTGSGELLQRQQGLRRPHRSQDSVLSSEGASSSCSAGEPSSPCRHTPSSDYGCASGASTPLSTGSPPPSWQSTRSSPATSPVGSPSGSLQHLPRQRERKNYGVARHQTAQLSGNWPQETWKRWEIIASEHTEQETLV